MEKEVKVSFETITPVWTGDAFGKNSKIRPSSIMGSLRFWFEVISYFSGVTNDNDYRSNEKDSDSNRTFMLKDKLDYEVFKKEFLNNKVYNYRNIDRILANSGISLPSRIFGCTGWKSMVKIKEIKKLAASEKEYEEKEYDKNFPHGRVKFKELKYTKINKKGEKVEVIPAWYFSEGFYGEFYITFLLPDILLKSVFYPLLTFIEKFGFVGGKWNIGYGRLKIKEVEENNTIVENWRSDEFGFDKFYKDDKEIFKKIGFNDLTEEVKNFDSLEKPYAKKVFFYYIKNPDNISIKEEIKRLIKEKASHRRKIKSNYSIRHDIFGTTSGGVIGSKILPWININNDKSARYGFISIVPILQLGKGNKGGKNVRR